MLSRCRCLGSLQNFLNIDQRQPAPNSPRLDFSGDSTSDFGDFAPATKVRLARERGNRPALGSRFGVELPNASNESGLGNDQTNAFGSFLIEKNIAPVTILANLGLEILSDPTTTGSQDGLFAYGLALSCTRSTRALPWWPRLTDGRGTGEAARRNARCFASLPRSGRAD